MDSRVGDDGDGEKPLGGVQKPPERCEQDPDDGESGKDLSRAGCCRCPDHANAARYRPGVTPISRRKTNFSRHFPDRSAFGAFGQYVRSRMRRTG